MAIERTGKAKELFDQAEANRKNQAYEKAIAEYGEVIKLLPNDAESYDSRGACYSILEQEEKALDDYSKAISLGDPNDGYSYACYFGRRSALYLKLGENEKAKADLEKAVEFAPEDKEKALQYYKFGDEIMELTGNKREAAVYLKKAVELGDFSNFAKDKLDEWGM